MYHTILTALFFALPLLSTGCREYFDYSPYGIETDPHHLTASNIARIEKASLPHFEPFTFAVTADTHGYYDELKDLIKAINSRDDLDFLLIAGDITDFGMRQEFQWSVELLTSLKIPYLTVIGNHDALNNGKQNYEAFFGPLQYNFIVNQVKFIALNSNAWEFNDRVPRLDWLQNQLRDDHLYTHQIVLTHIVPDDYRFSPQRAQAYAAVLESNYVSLVAAGHAHTHQLHQVILSNGKTISYMVAGSPSKRRYAVVTVEADEITIVTEAF